MTESVPTWELQINQALMNAGAALDHAPQPETVEEAAQLAYAWVGLAQAWRERQAAELEIVIEEDEEVSADVR